MTNLILPTRRSFLTGLIAAGVCAPAIVRASSLMPVKAWREVPTLRLLTERSTVFEGQFGPIAIWNEALSAAEMRLIADGINPMIIRPSALTRYIPILHQ